MDFDHVDEALTYAEEKVNSAYNKMISRKVNREVIHDSVEDVKHIVNLVEKLRENGLLNHKQTTRLKNVWNYMTVIYQWCDPQHLIM